MRLYDKNLTGLKALKREKALMKAQADGALQSFFGGDTPAETGTPDTAAGFADIFQTGLDVFTSKSIWNKALALALPLIDIAERKVEKGILKTIGKELLGGYLKWKGIEIGFRILSTLLKRKFSGKDD